MLSHYMFIVSTVNIRCWHWSTVIFFEVIAKAKFGSRRFIDLDIRLIVEGTNSTSFVSTGVFNL
jgi:hypothetical protein